MPGAIDREKMNWENDPILSRFSFEFAKKIRTNPNYHMVYMMLLDPNVGEYQIIEELLRTNEELRNILIKLREQQTIKYIKK